MDKTVTTNQPRVVIIGGGFGGLYAARILRRAPVRVTLIDQRNHHLFQPLLYQVATSVLSPGDIAQPIRHIFEHDRNVEVFLARAQSVDTARRVVRIAEGEVPYDFLIVATGATHSYFNHPEWAAIAPGLKTLEDAIHIRAKFLEALERAEKERDPQKRREILTFVIIGGGPTGVELAGTMSEIANHWLATEFRRVNQDTARIILMEGEPRVLAAYPPDLSASAEQQLRKLGVEVRTGSRVTRLEPDAVYVGDERIAAGSILWAAGVAASPLGKTLGAPVDRAGRVQVLPDLSIPDHPEVFVVGDLASVKDSSGQPVPGVAQAAIQMGKHAADMIARDLKGRPRENFRYRNKGSLATIGRAAAVADLGRLHFSGWLAWFAWLVVHIFFLIGFRNRMIVLLQWLWSYIGMEPGARLITFYGRSPSEEMEISRLQDSAKKQEASKNPATEKKKPDGAATPQPAAQEGYYGVSGKSGA